MGWEFVGEKSVTGANCDQCGHDFDDHILTWPEGDAVGGEIFCPVGNCECRGTWSADVKGAGESTSHQDQVGS